MGVAIIDGVFGQSVIVVNSAVETYRQQALQTRLDLYNSKLALASSPVLFWNLCIQSEI